MTKFLSLEWFKSKIERSVENVISKRIDNLIDRLQEDDLPNTEEADEEDIEYVRPYKNIKLVNDNLTVILNDGTVLSKSDATPEDFHEVRQAENEDDIFNVISSPQGIIDKKEQEKEQLKNKALRKGINILLDTEEFECKNGSVYLIGITRSIPQLLLERFIVCVYNLNEEDIDLDESVEYQSLKKFWMKCCLNPNAQSAEDLYEFLANHNFKIDRHGNFYAYRNVRSVNTDNKSLVDFVSNAYTKVKGVWKKKASNFNVYSRLGDFKIVEVGKLIESNSYWEYIGNLETLYLDLPNLQKKMFTSAHTGREDYRVGEVISMARYEGDDDNGRSCSKGFHAASKAYDYSGFGDTPILVIINPMDVLAVPKGEVGKLRTCRWFFATTLTYEERHILDDGAFDVTDLGDVFEEKCLENITEYVQNSFAEEVQRHTFNLSNISSSELEDIVSSLEDMKNSIFDRVVNFD